MRTQSHVVAAMAGLVFAGATAALTMGAVTPARADVMAGAPHRLISGGAGGAGGAAAVGPWGAAAGGGGGGGGGTLVYNPNQAYNPLFVLP